jgi:hypothetical protein
VEKSEKIALIKAAIERRMKAKKKAATTTKKPSKKPSYKHTIPDWIVQKGYMTQDEVMARYNVARSTLTRRRSMGTLKFQRIKGRIFYTVEQWDESELFHKQERAEHAKKCNEIKKRNAK